MKEFLIKTVLALMVYISPVYELLAVMFVFVAVDFVTGLIASNKKGVPRSSRRGRKSIAKLVGYMSAVLLSYMIQVTFNFDWLVAHRYIGAFICVVEFISILENFAVITEHPFFIKLIKIIRGKASKADNLIGEIINEKNSNDSTTTNGGGAPNK